MKAKTIYYCTECGNETPKWQGQCHACGSWNTIVEQPAPVRKTRAGASAKPDRARGAVGQGRAKRLSEVDGTSTLRFSTGLAEFDRVLGGGAVSGSLVLIGGAPGVGKSTLLLQICSHIARSMRVLYVTGEESEQQIKMRAERLGAAGDFFVLAETRLADILSAAEEIGPDVMIVDSIQTLYSEELTASPGSVAQVKECAMALLSLSKNSGATVFVVGHINKEGAIAGPKVLEHAVDCVLYFEGEPTMQYRILRAAKNRFGSTNEIGVFEMGDKGLAEVRNPSELLLSGRPLGTPGTCVVCAVEGTRPVLAEIQALVAVSSFNVPRRNANGIDYGRAMMLLAVLEKRGGLRIGGCDAYINVIGGLTLTEPAADLATVLALASSYKDKPVPDDLVAIGEVGLTGELRPVSHISARLAEIRRLGFTTCLMPKSAKTTITAPAGLKIITARTVSEAIGLVF
ncbi:MAG: DNA repair protein RadA [Clostridiales bacterium]|nr:DNA repair protein RadA [Clostridiales bacterium]